ncbi:MAG: potassium-transporting ATPase subunit KdpA, partial [Erysipelotrichia bacterium]|nr:potassium-transporting ATPase subunit KdpA [Erysipelotrichia bacterium]
NTGTHGFSEVLYAFTSAGGNNGSAFAGLNANTPFLNTSIGIIMIFARFLPILAILAIAGSMVQKKTMATSTGTLATHNALFITLLIIVVLIIGALSFFPALSLGPIAEFFTQMI